MNAVREKVYSYIRKHNMINEGDSVCVGLSGGADSVFLLQILYELKEKLNITLSAFHVNHCLRGDESDTDMHFAEELCRKMNIDIHVFHYDVKKLAENSKKGLEETGRTVRRQAALECVQKHRVTKTALAHHMNDRAETMLFNLVRGSSVSGLKGISPVNGNVIRPLLCLERSKIEEELEKRGMSWRTDSSNLKDDYTRNKMRNRIIPYLEENINAQCIRHIGAAARDLEEADIILRETARQRASDVISEGKGYVLISPDILGEKRLIAGYILMDALKGLTGSAVDLTRGHTEDILRLMEKQCGRSVDLPYCVRAERVYEGIRLSKTKVRKKKEEICIELPVDRQVFFGGLTVKTRIFNKTADCPEIPKKIYTKWFDYDKISVNAVLRNRRSGDYLTVDGKGHRKKLKEYFIEEKIPAEKRDDIICLAVGPEIVWVIGHRISENYKVSESTGKIIEIEITGGNGYEGKDKCYDR